MDDCRGQFLNLGMAANHGKEPVYVHGLAFLGGDDFGFQRSKDICQFFLLRFKLPGHFLVPFVRDFFGNIVYIQAFNEGIQFRNAAAVLLGGSLFRRCFPFVFLCAPVHDHPCKLLFLLYAFPDLSVSYRTSRAKVEIMSPSCPSLKREDTRKVVLPIFRVSVQNGILAGAASALSGFVIFCIDGSFRFQSVVRDFGPTSGC